MVDQMKILLVLTQILVGVSIGSADEIDLNTLVPKLKDAVEGFMANNYANARNVGKLDVNDMSSILKNAAPVLLGVSQSFSGNANKLKNLISAIADVKKSESKSGVFIQVSHSVLVSVINAVKKLANLFDDLSPQLTDFADELTDHLTPFSVTPNGYLKVPKSFIAAIENIETEISTLNFDISNEMLTLEGDLQNIENDLNSSEVDAQLPSELLTDINNLLESSSNAYLTVGSEVRNLVTSLRGIRTIFKKTKKGTCVYIPIQKFTPVIVNGTKQIAQTYSTIASNAAQLNQQLGQLESYLKNTF